MPLFSALRHSFFIACITHVPMGNSGSFRGECKLQQKVRTQLAFNAQSTTQVEEVKYQAYLGRVLENNSSVN